MLSNDSIARLQDIRRELLSIQHHYMMQILSQQSESISAIESDRLRDVVRRIYPEDPDFEKELVRAAHDSEVMKNSITFMLSVMLMTCNQLIRELEDRVE
ncbi:MAG: hypothetical protein BGO01_13480 [Armatimonadetes bacterium 55-13]|nr:MAG: hypothetical protein BGO01_13480 [Armatimonadetes bacterium 55-13]